MKRRLFRFTALSAALSLIAVFAGCSKTVTLTDVSTETTESGTIVTYYYSDGSKKSYSVQNGNDATVESAYALWLEKNGWEDSAERYNDFLKEYLTYTTGLDNSKTIQKTFNSVAAVYCEYAAENSLFGGLNYKKDVKLGSASIWKIESEYTYLVTNYHVIYCSNAYLPLNNNTTFPLAIHCYLYGSWQTPQKSGEKDKNSMDIYEYGDYAVECEYVGGAVSADLAVLKAKTDDLKKINPDMKAVTFADEYYTGQTVYTVGNPLGYGFSATEGIICVDNEYIPISLDGNKRYYRSMRIDTALYEGNSGGGLFNADGKFIGVANAGDPTNQNINYGIPLGIVKGVVGSIIDYSDLHAHKLKLGIEIKSDNMRYIYDPQIGYGKIWEDVTVEKVNAGSLAGEAGLRAGDVLTGITVGGVFFPILRDDSLSDALYHARTGNSVTVTYLRDGQEQEATFTVKADDIVFVE